MKSHNYIVSKDTLRILFCAASFQRQLDVVAESTLAYNLTSAVSVKVRVGNSIKVFFEFQFNLKTKTNNIITMTLTYMNVDGEKKWFTLHPYAMNDF